MKKLILLFVFIISIICCSQYISADEEYYKTENNGNGVGQGGNGNGNGGVGQGNGNGNAVPDAPIDSHIGLIGIFIGFTYIIIIQNRKKQKQ